MSRHSRFVQKLSEQKYNLRAGVAKAALLHKREHFQQDGYGKPLKAAAGYASGYSTRALERMSKQRGKRIFFMV